MRQHPIPQNVLDVEFKLFTKFTLREFTYLAIGVSVGGFFLYYTSKGQFPAVVGIPLFVIFSGIGAFFALVPINDQPADKVISNFFTAINRPTQRVWLNSTLRNQRTKPVIAQQQTSKVIGAPKIPTKKDEIFVEGPGDDILGDEPVTPTQEVKKEASVGVHLDDKQISITDDNILRYQFNIQSVDKLPGNINIWLVDKENNPIPNINTYLKDNNDKILYANKTGPNGYFLTNKKYPPGIYNIEFESNISKIPNIKLVRSKSMSSLPLRISAQ